MIENVNVPAPVAKAFPKLTSTTFVRRLASPVPLAPDTTFDIFIAEMGHFLVLVTTDYVDPLAQSQELKKLSEQHEFEFDHLIKPYDNDRIIEILEHDEMDDNFCVSIENTYFYAARLKDKK